MNFKRIFALVRRTFLLTFRGLDPLTDFFYWPFFDILVWGFTGAWMAQSSSNPHLAVVILTCLVMWQAVYRANLDISYNFLTELWSHNFINLFVTPLTIQEWIAANMIVGAINACIAALFGIISVWLLYGISILSVGLLFVPLFALLLCSGWILGLVTTCTLVTFGATAQKLVWVMGWLFVPFMGIYYPIEVMPLWAQTVSHSVPMSYSFKAMRIFIESGVIDYGLIGTGIALSALYITAAIALMIYCFHRSRRFGLARLEGF